MLRALAYRQAFFVLDVLLVVLLLCVAFFGVKGVLAAKQDDVKPPIVGSIEPDPVPAVGDLASYEPIVASKLFGDPPATPLPSQEPVVVQETEVETQLPLKLGGTIVSGALSSAIIEDQSRRMSDVYYLEQEVTPKVTLIEIRRDSVVLNNGNTGQREVLNRIDESGEPMTMASASGRPGALPQNTPPVREESGAKVVNRQEVIRELSENASKLLTEVKPEFKKDARGNTLGVTSSNISAIPLAKEVGLQDNDVVTSINGERIDSEEKLSQLMQKYGNATTIRLGIERNGRPQLLTLRLE
jgi:type II secretion system protein C